MLLLIRDEYWKSLKIGGFLIVIMTKKLYERMYEVLDELKEQDKNFSFTKWADLSEINGNSFGIMRSKIKKGNGARFNTLVQLAKPIERFPLLLKDKETDNLVKLNYTWLEYKKELPENYIPDSFKLFREAKDLNPKKVASLSDVSYPTYYNLEKGRSIPNLNNFESIAETLGFNISYFPAIKNKKRNSKCKYDIDIPQSKEDSELILKLRELYHLYNSIPTQLRGLGNSSMSDPTNANIKELEEALQFINKVDYGRNSYIKSLRFAKSYISVGMKKVKKLNK